MKRFSLFGCLLTMCVTCLFGCGHSPQGTAAAAPPSFPITEYESRGSAKSPETSSGNAPQPTDGAESRDSFRAIMWSPSWCGVCKSNATLLMTNGEPVAIPFRLEIREGVREAGDEAAFPSEVRAYANGVFPPGTDCAGEQRGWPVWQIELADGTWGFAHHARSAVDIDAIHKLKPGEPIPDSTFTEAWKRQNKPLTPVPQPVQKSRQRRTSGPVAMLVASTDHDTQDPRVSRIIERAIQHEQWERALAIQRPGYERYTLPDPDVVSLIEERERARR